MSGPRLFEAAVAAAAAIALLRGQPAGVWVAAVIGLHVALLAAFPEFRRRALTRWISAWKAAAAYPEQCSAIPWASVAMLVAMPSAALILLRDRGIQSGDSRPVVLTAASLLRARDATLSEFVPMYIQHRLFTPGASPPYFFLPSKGEFYSHYPSGMVPFALPVVAASLLVGGDLDHPMVHERLEKLTAALVAAMCLGLFFLLALHLSSTQSACTATILLATGSAMFSTIGQALWQHGGVIFWLELLLLTEFRSFQARSWKTIAFSGLCCALMLTCRLSAGVIVAAFGGWLLVRSPGAAVGTAFTAIAGLIPWALVNRSLYGSLLGPMVVQANGAFWSFTDLGAWAGILVSPTHGLLLYQPWIWLLPLAAAWCSNRRRIEDPSTRSPRGWQAWAILTIALHLALVSGWKCWWGGWCWGSRLAADIVPLAALLMLSSLTVLLTSRRGRLCVLTVMLISAALHIPSVYLEQSRWYQGLDHDRYSAALWNWSSPPFVYPLRR